MICTNRRAFTLVEIIIVVLILGLLASIVIPQFANSTDTSRDASAKTTLQFLRGQIEVFKTQHGGFPPQTGNLWTLMQTSSSTTCTALPASGTNFGPYFRSNPLNPWNNSTVISTNATDTNAGWYYSASGTDYTLQIRNIDGTIITTY